MLTFWSGAIAIPVVLGCLGAFVIKGAIPERMVFVMLAPLIYGAVFFASANSTSADADAPILLAYFVAYWAFTGSLCACAIYFGIRALRTK